MATRPLRILFLVEEMEAITAGGTERQILQMNRLLRKAGMEPEVCIFRHTAWLTEDIAGCPVHNASIGKLASVRAIPQFWRLVRWMRAKRFDVVQTFFIEANILGPILARFARVPLILGSRRNLNYWMKPHHLILQRISNRFVSRLVANCEAVRQRVAAMERFPLDRIDVVYNSIDADQFRPNPEIRRRVRNELQIGEEQVVIGNVSTLRPVKGVQHFVAAAAVVRDRAPAARFVVIGDGPLRPAIDQQIADLQLGPVFRLLGSQEEIAPYLQAMDIAVLSSESEGFSNSILEYMAAGLPCVATDVGGNREALGDADGAIVPPADAKELAEAILNLVNDPNRRRELAAKSLVRIDSIFSLENREVRLAGYYLGSKMSNCGK
jgi:glycosyltransferase involved in cell wall biosynthesis